MPSAESTLRVLATENGTGRGGMPWRALTLALIGLLGVAAVCLPVCAQTARAVLDKAKTLDDTTRRWNDRTQRMTLTIHDPGGAQRQRDLKVYTKRYPDGEEKAISFFLAPREVQGVGFLQWAHKGRADEQWLYLPELKRTRQVAPRQRDESFMGTDFSYRDLEILGELPRWSEAEAPSKLLGEETSGGAACYKIELQPQQEDMPYHRILLSMDRETLVPRKLDFFDEQGTHTKTLTLDGIVDVGAIPTAQRLEMRQLQRGSHTMVELPEVRYDTGLPDDLFTQRYLDRGTGP